MNGPSRTNHGRHRISAPPRRHRRLPLKENRGPDGGVSSDECGIGEENS